MVRTTRKSMALQQASDAATDNAELRRSLSPQTQQPLAEKHSMTPKKPTARKKARSQQQQDNKENRPDADSQGADSDQDMDWKMCMIDREDTIRLDLRLEAQLLGDKASSKKDQTKNTTSMLYQVETLASLDRHAQGQDDASLQCQLVSDEHGLCVCVGKQVHLMDAQGSALRATMSLDCDVDLAAFNVDGSFLVIGDRLGSIHFVHVSSKTVVFSQALISGRDRPEHRNGRVFQHVAFLKQGLDAETETLMVVLQEHLLMRFTHVDFHALNKALSIGDKTMALKVKEGIQMSRLVLSESGHFAFGGIVNIGQKSIVAGCGAGPMMQVYEHNGKTFAKTEECDLRLLQGKVIVQLTLSPVEDIFLSLDDQGNLGIWDAESCILVHYFTNLNIESFQILEQTDLTSDIKSIKLVILKQCPDHQKRIELIEFPNMTTQFVMTVAPGCWLTQSATLSSNQAAFFVEERIMEGSSLQLFLRSVSETVPLNRFQDLLRKRKFAEAEALAEAFSLDKEAVSKQQIQAADSDGDLEEIVSRLTSIKDDSFVIEYCLHAHRAKMSEIWQLLKIARDRSCSLKEDCENADALVHASYQAIRRFGTYNCIFTGPFDHDHWQRFRTSNLMEFVSQLFAAKQFVSAILLWRRHSTEPELCEGIIEALNAIPDSASLSDYVSWLKEDILPRSRSSNHREKILPWMEQRARRIEVEERKPHNALSLLQLFESSSQAQFFVTAPTPALYVDQVVNSASGMFISESIANLLKQLEDIRYLWDIQNYYISLADYSRETPSSIALALLDRVAAVELLQCAIDECFQKYAEKHNLNTDELLVEYCHETMDMCKHARSDSSWEPRVLVLLANITDPESQFELVLEALRHCSIPWSREIEQLIQENLTKNARRQTELKEQYELMKLKLMLFQHGIKNVDLSDVTLAKAFIKHILKKTSDTKALQDAMQLVQANHNLCEHEVYSIWLQNLCIHGKFAQMDLVLRSLPEANGLMHAEETLIWLEWTIDEAVDGGNQEFDQVFVWATEAAAIVSSFLMGQNSFLTVDALKAYGQLSPLFKEFLVPLKVSQFLSNDCRYNVIREYAAKEWTSGTHRDANDPKIVRLAEILAIPRAQLRFLMAVAAIDCNNLDFAFQTIRLLLDDVKDDASSATKIVDIVKKLVEYVGNHLVDRTIAIPDTIMTAPMQCLCLLQETMVFCPSKDISVMLDLSKNLEVMCRLLAQSEAGEYNLLLNKKQKRDSFAAGLFLEHFDDPGLVFKTEKVIPLAKDFCLNCSLPDESLASVQMTKKQSKQPQQDYSAAALKMFLKENRAYPLALTVFQLAQERKIRQRPSLERTEWEEDIHFYHFLLETLLVKVIAHKKIDSSLAFALMMALPQKVAFDGLRSGLSAVNNEFHRLIQIAHVGMAAASLWQQRTFTVQLETLATNAKWWEELKLLGIPFVEERFRMDDAYRRSFVSVLHEKTSFDILTVLDFGRDFNIEDDYVFLEYTKLLLAQDDVLDYQTKVISVVDEVVNKAKLLRVLKEATLLASPYDYERVRFIFEMIVKLEAEDAIAKKAFMILDILTTFERRVKPNEEEYASIAKLTKSLLRENALKISTKRLPYHKLVVDAWSVLEPELNTESLSRLLPLAVPLDLSTDQFYVVMVKKTISSLNTGFRVRFSDVKGFISKIRDPRTAATALMDCSVSFPVGPDRVNSLRMALTLAEKWKAQLVRNNADEEVAVMIRMIDDNSKKIQLRLRATELEIILARDQLTRYMELIEDPRGMLTRMYMDLSEIAFSQISFSLHAICEEIADIFSISIEELRESLIQEWIKLKFSDSNSEIDELPSKRLQVNNTGRNEEQLLQLRLCYLCKAFDQERAINILLRIAYEPSQKITTTSRIRSLNVLFQLAGKDAIDKVHKFDEAKEYLRVLYYMADCEELRISVRSRELYKLEKDALARTLWMQRNQDPRVVELIINLMLDFNVFEDTALWQNALCRLAELNRFQALLVFLESISAIPSLAKLNKLPELWSESICHCLSDQAHSTDDKFLTKLIRLIHQCPFIYDLDWAVLIKALGLVLSSNMKGGIMVLFSLAVVVSKEATDSYLLPCWTSYLDQISKQEFEALIKLVSERIHASDTSNLKCLLSTLFKVVDRKIWFDILLPYPSLLQSMILYLIKYDQIDRLVHILAKSEKWSRLHDLLHLYFREYSDRKPADSVTDVQDLLLHYQRMTKHK